MLTIHNPDVSVVMAVRNEQRYLDGAVRSILDQNGVNHELIVIDDNSTDDTLEIVTALAKGDQRIRVLRNPKSGKSAAFNLGVSAATGRFVCLFAGDDLMPQGSLAARFNMVKDRPMGVPVVGLCKLKSFSTTKRFDGHVLPRGRGRGSTSGVSPLMNRLALQTMFPVPESLPNEDTWLYLCLTNFPDWDIVHSDIIGCDYRVHDGNSINMMSSFDDYNRKFTARREAFSIFYARFQIVLGEAAKRDLSALIHCENHRRNGNAVGVLFSDVRTVEKLRSLATSGPRFYAMRQKFYGLFSGW